MLNKIKRIISLALCLALLFEQTTFAQVLGQLDLSAKLAGLGATLIQEKFRPLHLRYLAYDAEKNNFNLLLDKGSNKEPGDRSLEAATKTLLNFFFVGLSLPDDSFWVNLRPDLPDNVIDAFLAKTDVGKILLAADVQLKKDTALATSPQTPEGKQYWDSLYKKASELFGYDNITIPTLVRPWIVPGEVIVRETQDNAYIYKATLKVMLEDDYLKGSITYDFKDPRQKALNEYASRLMRQLIIPKLTREVNSAKRYAPLRQVYYSLILAQWFKAKYRGKGNPYAHRIDQRNLTDLISKESWSPDAYFKQYQDSFKAGEYNLKETVSTPYGQSVRTYVSGGISLKDIRSQASSPLFIESIRPFDTGDPTTTSIFSQNNTKAQVQVNSAGELTILSTRTRDPEQATPNDYANPDFMENLLMHLNEGGSEKARHSRGVSVRMASLDNRAFILHGINPRIVTVANSLLKPGTTWDAKLDITLALQPHLAAFTIREGNPSDRPFTEDMGVILKGGEITFAETGDSASQANGLYKRVVNRDSSTGDLVEDIKQAISYPERRSRGYNELNVTRPEIAGFYFMKELVDSFVSREGLKKYKEAQKAIRQIKENTKIDAVGKVLHIRAILQANGFVGKRFDLLEIMAKVSEWDLPVYIIDNGVVHEAIFDSNALTITPGRQVAMQTVLDTAYRPSFKKITETRARIENDSPFKVDAEGLLIQGRQGGRMAYLDLMLRSDTQRRTQPGFAVIDGVQQSVQEIARLANFLNNTYTRYFIYQGKIIREDTTRFNKDEVADIDVNQRPLDEFALKRTQFDVSGNPIVFSEAMTDPHVYLDRLNNETQSWKKILSDKIGSGETATYYLQALAFHLYGFADEARKDGHEELAQKAERIAAQTVSRVDYQNLLKRRLTSQDTLRINPDLLDEISLFYDRETLLAASPVTAKQSQQSSAASPITDTAMQLKQLKAEKNLWFSSAIKNAVVLMSMAFAFLQPTYPQQATQQQKQTTGVAASARQMNRFQAVKLAGELVQIDALQDINGVPIARIEAIARPGGNGNINGATSGFLGAEPEKLKDVLKADHITVTNLGTTHKELAGHLKAVIAKTPKNSAEAAINYDPGKLAGNTLKATGSQRLKVEYLLTRGRQHSLFENPGRPADDPDNLMWPDEYTITNLDNGLHVLIGGNERAGVIGYIERHGFYEGGGKGNPYRVDPEVLHAVLTGRLTDAVRAKAPISWKEFSKQLAKDAWQEHLQAEDKAPVPEQVREYFISLLKKLDTQTLVSLARFAEARDSQYEWVLINALKAIDLSLFSTGKLNFVRNKGRFSLEDDSPSFEAYIIIDTSSGQEELNLIQQSRILKEIVKTQPSTQGQQQPQQNGASSPVTQKRFSVLSALKQAVITAAIVGTFIQPVYSQYRSVQAKKQVTGITAIAKKGGNARFGAPARKKNPYATQKNYQELEKIVKSYNLKITKPAFERIKADRDWNDDEAGKKGLVRMSIAGNDNKQSFWIVNARIKDLMARFGIGHIHPYVVHALIFTESANDSTVVSKKSAYSLMQVRLPEWCTRINTDYPALKKHVDEGKTFTFVDEKIKFEVYSALFQFLKENGYSGDTLLLDKIKNDGNYNIAVGTAIFALNFRILSTPRSSFFKYYELNRRKYAKVPSFKNSAWARTNYANNPRFNPELVRATVAWFNLSSVPQRLAGPRGIGFLDVIKNNEVIRHDVDFLRFFRMVSDVASDNNIPAWYFVNPGSSSPVAENQSASSPITNLAKGISALPEAAVSPAIARHVRDYPQTKFIFTTDLSGKLPYPSGLRQPLAPSERKLLPPSVDKIDRVMVSLPEEDTLLVSHTKNGTQSVARLGFLEDGRPVALLTVYPDVQEKENEIILKQFQGGQIAEELGLAGKMHGVFEEPNGKLSVVMEIAEGDFAYPVRERITAETFQALREANQRMFKEGINAIDLQFFISSNHSIELIDKIGLLEKTTTPALYSNSFLSRFLGHLSLSRSEVAQRALKETSREEPSLIISLDNYLQNHSYAGKDIKDLVSALRKGTKGSIRSSSPINEQKQQLDNLVGGEASKDLLIAMRETVNPDQKEGTVAVSLAGGADIATVELSTNADKIIIFDKIPFRPRLPAGYAIAQQLRGEYLSGKQEAGLGKGAILKKAGHVLSFLMAELNVLGAENINVEQSSPDGSYGAMTFDWGGRKRVLEYRGGVDLNTADFTASLSGQVDYVILKAGWYGKAYGIVNAEQLIERASRHLLKEGGFMIGDYPLSPTFAETAGLRSQALKGIPELLDRGAKFGYWGPSLTFVQSPVVWQKSASLPLDQSKDRSSSPVQGAPEEQFVKLMTDLEQLTNPVNGQVKDLEKRAREIVDSIKGDTRLSVQLIDAIDKAVIQDPKTQEISKKIRTWVVESVILAANNITPFKWQANLAKNQFKGAQISTETVVDGDGIGNYLRVGRLMVFNSQLNIPEEIRFRLKGEMAVTVGGPIQFIAYLVPMLHAMQNTDFKGKTVIDYGAGSGVLGLVALHLGAKRVIAIETSESALLGSERVSERQGESTARSAKENFESAGYTATILREIAASGLSQSQADCILVKADLNDWFKNESSLWQEIAANNEVIRVSNLGYHYDAHLSLIIHVLSSDKPATTIIGGYIKRNGELEESLKLDENNPLPSMLQRVFGEQQANEIIVQLGLDKSRLGFETDQALFNLYNSRKSPASKLKWLLDIGVYIDNQGGIVSSISAVPQPDKTASSPIAIEEAADKMGDTAAAAFLEKDPRAWVVFSDMLKLSPRNDHYGRKAADFFIQDAIAIAKKIAQENGGVSYRLGDRADEIALVLPGSLRQADVEKILSELQVRIAQEYSRFAFAVIPTRLIHDALFQLGQARNVRSLEELPWLAPEGKTTIRMAAILFEKDAGMDAREMIDNLLGKFGVMKGLGTVEEIHPPYLPPGAVNADPAIEDARQRLMDALSRAEQAQRQAKAQGKAFGFTLPQKREKINPIFESAEKEATVEAMIKSQKESLLNEAARIKDSLYTQGSKESADSIVMDENYAAFNRRGLAALFKHILSNDEYRDKVIPVLEHPDTFYFAIQAYGKWQLVMIRNAIIPGNDAMAKEFMAIMQASGRTNVRQAGKFPFKVVNDHEKFGHHFGNQLIKLLSTYLFKHIQEAIRSTKGALTAEELATVLKKATADINSFTSRHQISVDLEAISISIDDIKEKSRGNADKIAKKVLNVLEVLANARRDLLPPGPSHTLRDSQPNFRPIVDSNTYARAVRALRGLEEVTRANEGYAAALQSSSPVRTTEDILRVLDGRPTLLWNLIKENQDLRKEFKDRCDLLLRAGLIEFLKQEITKNPAIRRAGLQVEDLDNIDVVLYGDWLRGPGGWKHPSESRSEGLDIFILVKGKGQFTTAGINQDIAWRNNAGLPQGLSVAIFSVDALKENEGATLLVRRILSAGGAVIYGGTVIPEARLAPLSRQEAYEAARDLWGLGIGVELAGESRTAWERYFEALIFLEPYMGRREKEEAMRFLHTRYIDRQPSDNRQALNAALGNTFTLSQFFTQFYLGKINDKPWSIGFHYFQNGIDTEDPVYQEITEFLSDFGDLIGEIIRKQEPATDSSAEEPTSSSPITTIITQLKQLQEAGDLETEFADLFIAQILAEALGLNDQKEVAGKTTAGLFREILQDTSEKSMRDHISQYWILFDASLGRVKALAEARQEVFNGIQINSLGIKGQGVIKEVFNRLLRLAGQQPVPASEVAINAIDKQELSELRDRLLNTKTALEHARVDQKKTAEAAAVVADTLSFLRSKAAEAGKLQPVYLTFNQIDFDAPQETDIPNALGIFMMWADHLINAGFPANLAERFNNSIARSLKMLNDSIEVLDKILVYRGGILATKGIESMRGTTVIIDINKLNQSASSPISDRQDEKGGIDFRSLPITVEPVNVTGSSLATPPLNRVNDLLNDPDLKEIENMINAGIMPSAERIREYTQACLRKEDPDRQMQKVLSCIADILKLQEDYCQETEAGFRELIMAIETRPLNEISAAVGAINTIVPKSPQGQK